MKGKGKGKGKGISSFKSSSGKGKGKGGKGKGKGNGKGGNESGSKPVEPTAAFSNPFEARNNSKAKHEVVNRRVKGGQRNVAKARAEATERRNNTLLVEYRNRKSANSVVDRRFGEGDASMSIEERMYERFKRERQKRGRGDGLFSLNDNDGDSGGGGGGEGGGGGGKRRGLGGVAEEMLTHRGQSLTSTDFGIGDVGGFHFGRDDDSDDDGNDGGGQGGQGQVDRAYVEEMHFGGGVLSHKSAAADAAEGAPKSRKEMLEDMIKRSKEQKVEKAKAKTAQVDGVDKLDNEYSELAALLDFRKPQGGGDSSSSKDEAEAAAAGKQVKERFVPDEYEKQVKALNFETRSKPQDRLKTDEEVAAEELEKLQGLERRRVKRMRGDADSSSDEEDEEEDDDDSEDGGGGGRKGRNKKGDRKGKQSSSGPETAEGGTKGSVGGMLTKEMVEEGYTIDPKTGFIMPPASSDEDDDETEESEEEEEEEDEDEGSGDEDDGREVGSKTAKGDGEVEDNQSDDDDDDDDDDEEENKRFDESDENEELASSGSESDGDSGDDGSGNGVNAKSQAAKAGKETVPSRPPPSSSSSQSSSSMPFVIPCPKDVVELTALIDEHCCNSRGASVGELLSRVRKCSALALNRQGGENNRAKLHNLYDALLRRLLMVGDQLGASVVTAPRKQNEGEEEEGREAAAGLGAELDVLCVNLFELSHELGGDTVASLWRRYLAEVQHRLVRSLRSDAAAVAAQILDPITAVAEPLPLSQAHGGEVAGSGVHSRLESWCRGGQWGVWPSAWPTRGDVVLLKCCGAVFPSSDFRHGVTTPTLLVLGQALAQCPVRSGADLSAGLLCCGTMLGLCAEAKRVAPEALIFLRSVLVLFADPSKQKQQTKEKQDDTDTDTAKDAATTTSSASSRRGLGRAMVEVSGAHPLMLPSFDDSAPLGHWLRASLESARTNAPRSSATDDVALPVPPLGLCAPPLPTKAVLDLLDLHYSLKDASGGEPGDATPAQKKKKKGDKTSTSGSSTKKEVPLPGLSCEERLARAVSSEDACVFASAALGACLRLVARAAAVLVGSKAFVELFEETEAALRILGTTNPSCGDGDAALAALHGECAAVVARGMAECRRTRRPMAWQAKTKAAKATESLAPRFEEQYSGNKRPVLTARDEEKALSKQIKREHKGAARELRRDSEFLARARDEERAEKTNAAKAERHKNFGWLEEQQATVNLQVRKGRGLAGGGSSVKKSAEAVLKSGKRQT